MTSKCFIIFFAPNSRSNLCKGHGAVQINAECCNSKNTPGGNELCLVSQKTYRTYRDTFPWQWLWRWFCCISITFITLPQITTTTNVIFFFYKRGQRHNILMNKTFNKKFFFLCSAWNYKNEKKNEYDNNLTTKYIFSTYFCTWRWGQEASRVGSSSSGSNSGFSLGGRVRKIFTEICKNHKGGRGEKE